MLEAYNTSQPKLLKVGQWHIPFGDNMDEDKLELLVSRDVSVESVRLRVAVARCARVSYYDFEGKKDYAADLKLYDRLVGARPRHLSPTEHVAQACSTSKKMGNFRGWKQHRYFLSDQNRTDPRIKHDVRQIKSK